MILVAIGSNLAGPEAQSPLQTCRQAVAALRRLQGLRVVRLSPWYLTDPVPPSGQPAYVNGIAGLAGKADPADLLARLQSIEAASGRVRSVRNAARSLDLDIIDVHGQIRDSPDPILPHPRAHERAFVLMPLADIAPGWVHARNHRTVEQLLAALGSPRLLAISPDRS